ncbi:NB-ARC domain-containing protein [Deinococcus yavapaiensis]|uniref:Putative ATPase n=1 Tax=Deinococcus yavapaiensis KR-236 TaxID=694435 RepID=A0A318SAD9_9DEIO|nr:NB-ARC domain-containing protein [Deinococcus yavapaiensis]PYE53194.1 putative ATPase [Deinococcus yavapaiensis KR-236]
MNTAAPDVHAHPSVPLGRTEDVERVKKLLQSGARLVTLRGPGGIGKTTLAAHLARTLQGAYDRVLFVDLTAERDPRRVLDVLAAHLSNSERRADALQRLVMFAEDQRVLLILDNFEQVVEAAVDVMRLLDATTTLHVLVTSRVTLRVHAEHEVEVTPLTLPDAAGRMADSAAEQLFVQRVRQVNATFELNDTARPLVASIVTRLEGVPLAIELAASRLRTFSLPDLLAQLDHPLHVLRADFRDRPERLRSLRAAVQWSYDLLGEEDQEVFACCAVFEGSFTPEALMAVWGDEDVLNRVEHLLEQSFLLRADAAVTRWKMLQPLRELALEHLARHPQGEAWRERHARYYLHVLDDMRQGYQGPHPRARELYLPDYANMRAGLTWMTERGHAEGTLRYIDGMNRFWLMSARHAEGRALTEAALRLPSAGLEHLRMPVLLIQADNLQGLGDIPAMEACMREHQALSEVHGTDEERAWSKNGLSISLYYSGKYEEALQLTQQVIDWFEAHDPHTMPSAEARMVYAVVTLNSVWHLMALRQYEAALERATRAVDRLERAGDIRATSHRGLIGDVLVHLGRWREAALEYQVALRHTIDHGHAASNAPWGFMQVMAERQPLLAVSFAAFGKSEVKLSMVNPWHLQALEALKAALPAEDFERAWQVGERWTPEEALMNADAFIAEQEQGAPSAQRSQAVPQGGTHGLTAREVQVLELVAAGHPDRKIAKLLNISSATASKHVSNILSKLGLRNRTELARWVMERAPYKRGIEKL